MTIRVLIVDDEPLARARLSRLLGELDDVYIVGEATDGLGAIEMANTLAPDLVLMDIEMPNMNGIEAAGRITELKPYPAVIFSTAYDEYAIEAFKVKATDYLLKPVSKSDLAQAIERVRLELVSKPLNNLDGEAFLHIKGVHSMEKLPFVDVVYFRTEGKHVVVGTVNGQERFIDSTLKELECIYPSKIVRVHRNSLVSKSKLKRLLRTSGEDIVELVGSEKSFIVSRRMLSSVKRSFN